MLRFKFIIIGFFIIFIIVIIALNKKPKDFIPPESVCKDCNVILITMTTLRYDHMSMNGYNRPTTPNLDILAKESLVFNNAFSQSSWTLPESVTIYSSLYPFQHGVMNRYDGSTLSPTAITLIDVFNKKGYKTAAFTGGFDYNPVFGHTDRFKEFKECAEGKLPEYPRQAGTAPSKYGGFDCSIPLSLDWLNKNYSQKFFMHVQGFDLHCPFHNSKGGKIYDKDYSGNIDFSVCLNTFYNTEPKIINGEKHYPVYSSTRGSQEILLSEEDRSHLVALYDESITFADKEIAKLLNKIKELGLDSKTIIVVTSEHGDMFGEHGRFMRGGPLRGTFYDEAIHVPLIIKHPKISKKNTDELVQQVDIAPTLFTFLGFATPSRMEGKSLIPLIFDNKIVNEYIFAGGEYNPDPLNTRFNKKTRTDVIRDKRWKLIREVIFDGNNSLENLELYDIANDKEEQYNLKDEKQDVLKTLKDRLNMWERDTRRL